MHVGPMNRHLAVGFAVGAVVGGGGAYLYVTRLKPSVVQQGGLVDGDHHAAQLGLPRTEAVRTHQGYVAAFDFRTRNPKWVLERITEDSANGSADRKDSNFSEDQAIEVWLRSKLSDFRGSGYDRGHMAPAANHKGSQQAMDETFSMTNVSPQVGEGFNRDYWARFEKFVKDVTRKSDDVYVVTGPLWMPSLDEEGKWQMKYPLIGQPPSLVSVPTHFYKVVLARGLQPDTNNKKGTTATTATKGTLAASQDVGVAAFVMPNAPIDPATPLAAFVVPLEPLESVAGTRFFPSFLSRERVQGLDASAQEVRASGLARMKVLDRQQLLESVHPRLALPASSTAAAAATHNTTGATAATTAAAAPAGAAQGPAAPVQSAAAGQLAADVGAAGVGRAKGWPQAKGCAHLCEVLACKLPPERFWEQGGGRGNGGGGGKGRKGDAGNSRALTRR